MERIWSDVYTVYNRDGSIKRFIFTEDFIRKSGKKCGEYAILYNSIKDEDLDDKTMICTIEQAIEYIKLEVTKKLLIEASKIGAEGCIIFVDMDKEILCIWPITGYLMCTGFIVSGTKKEN